MKRIITGLIFLTALADDVLAGQKDTSDYFLPTRAIKPTFGMSHPFLPGFGLDVEFKLNSRFSFQSGLHYLRWDPECTPSHNATSCTRLLGGGKIRFEFRRYFFPKPNRSLHGAFASIESYALKAKQHITNFTIVYPPDSLVYPHYSFETPPTEREIHATGMILRLGWQGATFRFGIAPSVGLAFYHAWTREETGGISIRKNAMRVEPDFGFRIVLFLGDRLPKTKPESVE